MGNGPINVWLLSHIYFFFKLMAMLIYFFGSQPTQRRFQKAEIGPHLAPYVISDTLCKADP